MLPTERAGGQRQEPSLYFLHSSHRLLLQGLCAAPAGRKRTAVHNSSVLWALGNDRLTSAALSP